MRRYPVAGASSVGGVWRRKSTNGVLPTLRAVCVLRPPSSSSTRLDSLPPRPTAALHGGSLVAWRSPSQSFTAAGGAAAAVPPSPSSTSLEGGFKDEHEYHIAADHVLEEVQNVVEVLEDALDDFEINYSQGVLNITMGQHGIWVLNKQTPNRQVWWSSPISGPLRFEYDQPNDRWITTRDKRELFSLLAQEILKMSGIDVRPTAQKQSTTSSRDDR